MRAYRTTTILNNLRYILHTAYKSKIFGKASCMLLRIILRACARTRMYIVLACVLAFMCLCGARVHVIVWMCARIKLCFCYCACVGVSVHSCECVRACAVVA